MTGFDNVFAPIGSDEFLRTYWLKRPVHIPGKRAQFEGLLTWDDLNAILEEHRLAPPRLKLYNDGKQINPSQYLTPSAYGVPRIDAGGLAVAIAGGATVVLDDVQEAAPKVRNLIESFQLALRTDAYANLYAGWHGQKALDLHWDPQEAIVLQLSGRKHWKVYAPTRENPIKNDVVLAEPPTETAIWDGILEDGDALYIPRGWWHVAVPLNEPSLHLTVSATPPTGLDFLGWAVARLRGNAEARGSLSSADEEAPARVHQLLGELLAVGSLEEFLVEWDSNIRPNPHIDLIKMAYRQSDLITGESFVRLASAHRLLMVRSGGDFEFTAAGRIWNVPSRLHSALARLSDAEAISVQFLAKNIADEAWDDLVKALTVLARAGIVLVN
jgi:hypothetical protein